MDHASAQIMEYTPGLVKSRVILSKFTHQEKIDSIEKGENLMHNKEQHEQLAYYGQIAEIIKNYDDVLLFGATDAKVELYNIIKKDHRFEKIRIEVKNTDKMTENQLYAFVTEHFSKN